MKKKLLDKKYLIEDARLDLYLKKLHEQPTVIKDEKPKKSSECKPRVSQRDKKPKPAPIEIPKKEESVADQIFKMYR